MTKKFTEEQYQKIVELQKDKFETTILSTARTNNYDFWDNLELSMIDIRDFVFDNNLYEELAALANPLTREWAHDKFVEKEKKYYWTSKKEDISNFVKRIYKDRYDMISDHSMMKNDISNDVDEQLTENEIKAWGYDPDMFDKEEV